MKTYSDKEINNIIARLCGWKYKKSPWYMRWLWGTWLTQKPKPSHKDEWLCGFIPNYVKDLNACFQMENCVNLNREKYVLALCEEVYEKLDSYWALVHATPRERCLAFIKVMTKVDQ